jgi:hypothetical protein
MDKEVHVVRAKNRLDPGYNGAESAGYRSVSLNLRIVTTETMALGVDTHVCELQLLHLSFAKIKVLPVNPCLTRIDGLLAQIWVFLWRGGLHQDPMMLCVLV